GIAKGGVEGRPLESGAPVPRPGHFTAHPLADGLVDKEVMFALLDSETVIADARPADRFAGNVAEPRPGLAAGHIPGSRSLPQSAFFHPDNSFKQGDEVRALFDEAGIDLARPLVATCGSG